MSERRGVEILEALLHLWEDHIFIQSCASLTQSKPLVKAEAYWPEFRKALLRARSATEFDPSRYAPTRASREELHLIPFYLWHWVSESKRVFRLSHEMQRRFSRISFGNVLLSEVQLPFNSFGVELAESVTHLFDNRFVLVTLFNLRYEGSDRSNRLFDIMSTTPDLAGYQGITPTRRRYILDLYKSPLRREQGVREAAASLKHVRAQIELVPFFGRLRIPDDQDIPIEEYLRSERARGVDEVHIMNARIVLNLCLYLESLPTAISTAGGHVWERSHTKPKDKREVVITDEAKVCSIGGTHVLDSMIVDKRSSHSRAGGYEVDPHWRRAHKRRPMGMGNDPTAPKSVKIPRTLVRSDRVPEVGVIKGSTAKVRR